MEDVSLYWFVAAAIFFIIEIFIPGFIMASIGIGCLLSFGAASLGMGLAFQFVFFTVGVLLGFIGIKPLLKHITPENNIKTNYEGYVGRFAKVIETIDIQKDSGCISLDGDQWKAISEKGQVIDAGQRVEIVFQESIIFTVKPIEQPKTEPSTKTASGLKSILLEIGGKEIEYAQSEIALFYSSQKNSFGILNDGKEIILDESLDKIESKLSGHLFFRANRQFLISNNIVKSFERESDGKIKVFLSKFETIPEVISVSRLKARSFTDWTEM